MNESAAGRVFVTHSKNHFKSRRSRASSDRRSIIARIWGRFRYGLATQEILDRLSTTLGLVIYPYYLVHEQIHPDLEPEAADDDYKARYLTEDDMKFTVEHTPQKITTETLVEKLRSGSRSIGLFINGDLAAYTWFRFDQIDGPIWRHRLLRLEHDEAYLYGMYVLPAYRGRRLAPLVRYRAYQELRRIGKRRLYSITMAFNASSRRFKQRLLAEEVELRLLIGLRQWKAIDFRLHRSDNRLETPRRQVLGRCRVIG